MRSDTAFFSAAVIYLKFVMRLRWSLHQIVFVYRVIQRECGLKTVRNRECQGSRRGDLGWTVGFTRIVSMVTVRQ